MIVVSAVRDFSMYDRTIRENRFLADATLACFDNREKKEGIARVYNRFLDGYDFAVEDWFIFCHEDWELKDEIQSLLPQLDKTSLYGPVGAILLTQDGGLTREYRGGCCEKKKDGTAERKLVGRNYQTGTLVDSFDCQCLIVHSSLIQRTNARFDEHLNFDLYVEDFCLTLRLQHAVPSRIVELKACHWSRIDDLSTRPDYFKQQEYLNRKYEGHLFAGICSLIGQSAAFPEPIKCDNVLFDQYDVEDRGRIYSVPIGDANDARRTCIDWIDAAEKVAVLDVGCACGDFAAALKREKDVRIWGMEYNPESVEIAKRTAAFEEVFQVDLNALDVRHYSAYSAFFDYIVLGDVLEHLLDPQSVLAQLRNFLKKDGYFLISLPNVAHASIKAALLVNSFEYTSVGVLDKTHLHFFTHRSVSEFLANSRLMIEKACVVGMAYQGLQTVPSWGVLPWRTKKLILGDYYSYIWQFVVKTRVDDEKPVQQLGRDNLEKLVIDRSRVPQHIKKLRAAAMRSELAVPRLLKRMRYSIAAHLTTGEKRLKYRKKLER
jgi:2-polyprenyl-3-methyl-5-hydroxy-6-metoxy-1,4-benzoquinol methylase